MQIRTHQRPYVEDAGPAAPLEQSEAAQVIAKLQATIEAAQEVKRAADKSGRAGDVANLQAMIEAGKLLVFAQEVKQAAERVIAQCLKDARALVSGQR